MAKCNTAVTPVHWQWSYCSLALSHRYFTAILFEIRKLSLKQMHLKMSSAKWQPFYPCGYILMQTNIHLWWTRSINACLLGPYFLIFLVLYDMSRRVSVCYLVPELVGFHMLFLPVFLPDPHGRMRLMMKACQIWFQQDKDNISVLT